MDSTETVGARLDALLAEKAALDKAWAELMRRIAAFTQETGIDVGSPRPRPPVEPPPRNSGDVARAVLNVLLTGEPVARYRLVQVALDAGSPNKNAAQSVITYLRQRGYTESAGRSLWKITAKGVRWTVEAVRGEE